MTYEPHPFAYSTIWPDDATGPLCSTCRGSHPESVVEDRKRGRRAGRCGFGRLAEHGDVVTVVGEGEVVDVHVEGFSHGGAQLERHHGLFLGNLVTEADGWRHVAACDIPDPAAAATALVRVICG